MLDQANTGILTNTLLACTLQRVYRRSASSTKNLWASVCTLPPPSWPGWGTAAVLLHLPPSSGHLVCNFITIAGKLDHAQAEGRTQTVLELTSERERALSQLNHALAVRLGGLPWLRWSANVLHCCWHWCMS